MTELVEAALRCLLDEARFADTNAETTTWTAPPVPTIKTKKLERAPKRTLSLAEINDLAKETELASDTERHDAIVGH